MFTTADADLGILTVFTNYCSSLTTAFTAMFSLFICITQDGWMAINEVFEVCFH